MADNDPTPIIRKRGKAATAAQVADEFVQLEKKRQMMSKWMAKRPKRLRQPTLNLFLADESDEEEQAAGSRQAASEGKTSTGMGSHAVSAPRLAGPVLMVEPI